MKKIIYLNSKSESKDFSEYVAKLQAEGCKAVDSAFIKIYDVPVWILAGADTKSEAKSDAESMKHQLINDKFALDMFNSGEWPEEQKKGDAMKAAIEAQNRINEATGKSPG